MLRVGRECVFQNNRVCIFYGTQELEVNLTQAISLAFHTAQLPFYIHSLIGVL